MEIPLTIEAEVEEITTVTDLVTLKDETLVFVRLKAEKLLLRESLFIIPRD